MLNLNIADYRPIKFYFFTILNVFVWLLVLVPFDVTITVVVHKTPDFKLSTFALILDVELERLLEEIVTPSESLLVLTSTWTPAVGNVELTFNFKAWLDPIAAKILPAPGSISIENTIADSEGVGVGVGVGVGEGESPPVLLQANSIQDADNK